MNQTANSVEPWATVTARPVLVNTPATDPNKPGDAAAPEVPFGTDPRLEALSALLAEDDRVGGVELRDHTTLGFATADPEVIAYTRPEHVQAICEVMPGLAARLGLELQVEGTVHEDDDWRDRWKQFYGPLRFGDGALLLRPSWHERGPDDPAAELVLDPGRAFGTGLHESTQLCLEQLIKVGQAWTKRPTPRAVLDLGCGSGILVLASCRLFGPQLGRVVAMDVDPEATETTRENAALNDVSGIEFKTGTVAELDPARRFELVIANIRPRVLVPIADDLVRRLAPGGELILSGILSEEGDEVAAAYTALGLVERARPTLRDWCALFFTRPQERG